MKNNQETRKYKKNEENNKRPNENLNKLQGHPNLCNHKTNKIISKVFQIKNFIKKPTFLFYLIIN